MRIRAISGKIIQVKKMKCIMATQTGTVNFYPQLCVWMEWGDELLVVEGMMVAVVLGECWLVVGDVASGGWWGEKDIGGP